mmetsp:Transcript_15238/g.39265  ORF Transcript_15238/g.39265 Transcript_15238/m.39265 type:complete len:246 (-) Transcript_15238:53-790(-)
MKRTSGAAFLADRDKGDAKEAKTKKGRSERSEWTTGEGDGFVETLRAKDRIKAGYNSLLSSESAGGPVAAAVRSEDVSTAKTSQPQCAWWQLQPGIPPVGPVRSKILDLSQLDKEVSVIALVAEVVGASEKATVTEAQEGGSLTRSTAAAWNVTLFEGGKDERKDLLRLRMPISPRPGAVWVVGSLTRGGPDEPWRAESIDEVWPLSRVKEMMALRFKDKVPVQEEKKEEDPMEKTRRLLLEAMK